VLIDTHCHFNLTDRFPDPASAINRAEDAGVERFVVVGIDLETSRIAVELADRFPSVFAAIGYHPTNTKGFDLDWLKNLEDLIKHPKVVAVGEIGLDYFWDDSPKEDQMKSLLAQIKLAEEHNLPVIFHCREAYPDLLNFLEKRSSKVRFDLHCFAGDLDQAKRAMKFDCFFGIDGPVTYKKADELRAVIPKLPSNRILLETDSPFLPPEPYRGKPNEPAYLVHVAKGVAEIFDMSAEQVADVTTRNAIQFFGASLIGP